MLDTSVAVSLRDGDQEVRARVIALQGPITISSITRMELEGGVYREPRNTAARRMRLDQMLKAVRVIAFEDSTAIAYGQIVAAAGYSRRKVIDRMIAAQALVAGATLVTLNRADFSDVPNLKLLAW